MFTTEIAEGTEVFSRSPDLMFECSAGRAALRAVGREEIEKRELAHYRTRELAFSDLLPAVRRLQSRRATNWNPVGRNEYNLRSLRFLCGEPLRSLPSRSVPSGADRNPPPRFRMKRHTSD